MSGGLRSAGASLLLVHLTLVGCGDNKEIAWSAFRASERAAIVVVERSNGDIEARGLDLSGDPLLIDELARDERATALFYEDSFDELGLSVGPLSADPSGVPLDGYVRAVEISAEEPTWHPVNEPAEVVRSFRAAPPPPGCPDLAVRWTMNLEASNTSSTANPTIPLVRFDEQTAVLIRANVFAPPRFWKIDANGVEEHPELADALPGLRIAGAAEKDGVTWISAITTDGTARIMRGSFSEGFVEMTSEPDRDPPRWLAPAGGPETGAVYGLDIKGTLSRADDRGFETLVSGSATRWSPGRHLAWMANREVLWITPAEGELHHWRDNAATQELSSLGELRAVLPLDDQRVFASEYDISSAQQRSALLQRQGDTWSPFGEVGFAVLWMGRYGNDGFLLAGAGGTLQVFPRPDAPVCDPVSFGIYAHTDHAVSIDGGYAVSGYILDVVNARHANLFVGFASLR